MSLPGHADDSAQACMRACAGRVLFMKMTPEAVDAAVVSVSLPQKLKMTMSRGPSFQG
jgi:hypothetical protein